MCKGVFKFPFRLNSPLFLIVYESLIIELIYFLFLLQVNLDVVTDDGDTFLQVHVILLELSHLLKDVNVF